MGCLKVLTGDDGEVDDNGLGVEGELPKRRTVLREQLIDHGLLGGSRHGATGGSAVRSEVP
jgi:hypothetical protein